MSDEYKRRSVMQDVENPPVIEKAKKPRMAARKARPRRIAGRLEYMPEVEAVAPAVVEAASVLRGEAAAAPPPPPPSEMAPLEAAPSAPSGERYVRLRVRVAGDQVEVVGARVVEGPLAQPERLDARLVYEAAVGAKQVARDAIRDVGVRRSFPPAEPHGEVRGHHIEELPSYEIAVRIPQQELTEKSLLRLRISVFRVKGPVPDVRATSEALLDQFPAELRLVAELKGIRLDDLSDRVQTESRTRCGSEVRRGCVP